MGEWTDWKYAGSAANQDRDEKVNWVNPTEAEGSPDATSAYCTAAKEDYGDWLYCSQFGFSTSDIPDGSTIDGIEVEIRRKGGDVNQYTDSALYLYYNGANRGDNEASATIYPTSLTDKLYGGSNSLWGYSWDDSYIRHSSFGIRLSPDHYKSVGLYAAYVDSVRIRVYYTAPAAGRSFGTIMG